MSKVSTPEMYNFYNSSIKNEKNSLISDKENYENSKEYLFEKIAPFKYYIDNFTNIDYACLNTLDKPIPEKQIVSITGQIGLDLSTLKRTLNIITEINKNLKKIDSRVTILENSSVKKDIFKEVIYRFNTKLSDEIVFKGYTLCIGFGLGNIRIKKLHVANRKKKRIDWNKSLKNKAEIIARSGTPFKVLERDENRKILKDNGGENWFAYYTNVYDYLWHWHKKKVFVLNSPYYKFRPTIYNNTGNGGKLGNVNKLKQLVTSESELLKNFNE